MDQGWGAFSLELKGTASGLLGIGRLFDITISRAKLLTAQNPLLTLKPQGLLPLPHVRFKASSCIGRSTEGGAL